MRAHFQAAFCNVLFAGAALFLGASSAVAVPACASGGLDSYIALNATGGCTVANVTLFNFSFSASPPSNLPGPPSPADININPVINGASSGLGFSSSLFTLSDNAVAQVATYIVSYSVDPPPIIVGEDLNVDPPFGSLVITQNVCESSSFANDCAGGISQTHSVTPSAPSNFLAFPTPTSTLDIQTIFSLRSSPGSPAGFDSASAGSVTASPEPGAMSLFGLGAVIIACGLRGRSARLARLHPVDKSH